MTVPFPLWPNVSVFYGTYLSEKKRIFKSQPTTTLKRWWIEKSISDRKYKETDERKKGEGKKAIFEMVERQ